jgi:DNA-binding NtrC family response regulator
VQGGKETILVCEDDDAVRRLTVQTLQEAGYTILAAEEGNHALQLAETSTKPIDLLLTDVVMRGLNGRQLAEKMEALFPHLGTVCMSGYPSDALTDMGALAQNVDILEKPYSRRSLLRCVREALDKPKHAKPPAGRAAEHQRTFGPAAPDDG